MRITLISPYPDFQAYGIRLLSACLKQEGFYVNLLFMPKPFTEKYEERVLNRAIRQLKGADLIGISLMTNFFDNAVQLSKKISKDLKAPVLWGGIHPTIRPEECLKYADMVCIGEGEKPLVDLARRMKEGRNYHDVEGIWFKYNGRIIRNKIPPLIQDLDSIPFPDYDYETHSILSEWYAGIMTLDVLEKLLFERYVTMYTRGCPFSCAYCCNSMFSRMYPKQSRVRKRSPGNVIEELIGAKHRFPFLRVIMFDDDAFFCQSIDDIGLFSRAFREHIGLSLYVTGAHPATITEKKLALLVDAGLTRIRVGIQTGSERTGRLYGRNYPSQQVEKAAKYINEHKDRIRGPEYDVILDNPWEADDDLVDTLKLLTKLPTPYTLYLYSLTFYPGTELYEKAKREGIIEDDLNDVYRKYYHGCSSTYLNRLFFLQKKYAGIGRTISPRMISLLTNKKLRQSKLHWLFYWYARFRVEMFLTLNLLKYLTSETIKDICRGDWTRARRYLTKFGRREKQWKPTDEGGRLNA